MLISIKIKNDIEKEIKEQKQLLKSLEKQEHNYKVDLSKEKAGVSKNIEYYDKVLKEAV